MSGRGSTMGQLDGKVAIVTGAGQGVGEGVALALADQGAAVCVSGRSLWKVDRTAEQINRSGGRAIAVGCDVTDRSQIEAMVTAAVEQLGRLDIIINNAQGGNDGEHGRSVIESITETE